MLPLSAAIALKDNLSPKKNIGKPMTLNSILSYSIIYQSSINHLSIIYLTCFATVYYLLLRFLTPYTPSRARLRNSSFGAEAATLAARFVAAAGSSFGPCRDTMDTVDTVTLPHDATRRSYRTPGIGWTGELIFHCHLHTWLGGCYFAKETLQSSRTQWICNL